jgi:hypothetical protein
MGSTSDFEKYAFCSTNTSLIVTKVYHNGRTLDTYTNLGSVINNYHDWGSQIKVFARIKVI